MLAGKEDLDASGSDGVGPEEENGLSFCSAMRPGPDLDLSIDRPGVGSSCRVAGDGLGC